MSYEDEFDQPSSGDMFKSSDHLGRLLLIEVKEFVPDFPTSLGKSDVVRADVTVLDAPNGPDVYSNTVVFGRALVGMLRHSVNGKPVLGRLGQGVAKPGQSAPYVLNEHTDMERQVAGAYLRQRNASQFAQPAAEPTPAPAAAAAPAAAGPIDTGDEDALKNLLASLGATDVNA